MRGNRSNRCQLAVSSTMRIWLLAVLGAFVCSQSHAQVRIMPAPVNTPILELCMYDDGCRVAVWGSVGVYVTHDH